MQSGVTIFVTMTLPEDEHLKLNQQVKESESFCKQDVFIALS